MLFSTSHRALLDLYKLLLQYSIKQGIVHCRIKTQNKVTYFLASVSVSFNVSSSPLNRARLCRSTVSELQTPEKINNLVYLTVVKIECFSMSTPPIESFFLTTLSQPNPLILSKPYQINCCGPK